MGMRSESAGEMYLVGHHGVAVQAVDAEVESAAFLPFLDR